MAPPERRDGKEPSQVNPDTNSAAAHSKFAHEANSPGHRGATLSKLGAPGKQEPASAHSVLAGENAGSSASGTSGFLELTYPFAPAKTTDKETDKAAEKSSGQPPDKLADKPSGKPADKPTDKAAEKSTTKAAEKSPYPIPEAAKEQYLKTAINKGTDTQGNSHFEYGDGVTVTLNKDKDAGSVRYPDKKGGGGAREIHFGPKAEDNYNIDITKAPDGGWSYDYGNGKVDYISQDGKSGYQRLPDNASDLKGTYTEKHWGAKPEDNYSGSATRNADGGFTKTFDNGKIVVENKEGIAISGYETSKQKNGVTTERHWGPDDKDWYTKTTQADGTAKTELIPRNYDSMIQRFGGVSDQFADRAKAVLDKMPRGMVEDLKGKGVKIALARNIQSYAPSKANETSGQPTTLSNTDGSYDVNRNTVVLMESYIFAGDYRNGIPPHEQFSYRVEKVLPHELSHAWDYNNHMPSHSEKFGIAYQEDLQKLNANELEEYKYVTSNAQYLGSYSDCSQELFAELNDAILAKQTTGQWGAERLAKSFPNTYAYVAGLARQRRFICSPADIVSKR